MGPNNVEFKLNCYPAAVENYFNKAGYFKCKACGKPYLRQATMGQRFHFAAVRLLWSLDYCKLGRFINEVYFTVESRKTAIVIRNHEERERETCI